MSLAAGGASSSETMGDEKDKVEDKEGSKAAIVADSDAETDNEAVENKVRGDTSESSFYTTEDEDDEDLANKIQLGPQVTLKEQFEKDKVCVVSLSSFFP